MTPSVKTSHVRSQVTVHDVAREVGLSKTTVSDALAGSGRVSAATRDRVRAAADKLGYISNRAARNLRRGSTGALGLYIPPSVRSTPFYMEFALGGAERAAESGFDLMLFAQRARRSGMAVDGAVVLDVDADDETLAELVSAAVAVVAAGRILGREDEFAVIETPDVETARAMFDLLRDRGAQRIGFVTPLRDFPVAWANDITDAYLQWCRENNREALLQSISVSCSDAELEAAVAQLLSSTSLDALVVGAEGWAGRVKPMLIGRGIQIGADFQLGTLSGDPFGDGGDPAIARVDMQPREFGAAAFGLLLDILEGHASSYERRTHRAVLVPASVDSMESVVRIERRRRSANS